MALLLAGVVLQGWDVLLRAFLTTFTARDNVLLLMMTKPFHSSDDFAGQMEASGARGVLAGRLAGWPAVACCLPAQRCQQLHELVWLRGTLSQLHNKLTVLCAQEWARQDLLQAGRRPKHLPSVYVLGQHVPQRSYPRLFKSADCFVLPTR
jgi:hypothetical protein